MYKSRVHAVSGNKVLADGKWLICIGNKRFSVGEPVWTDGRCAYGNYPEAQQPLVITAPNEGEIVPILLANWSRSKLELYAFERGNLRYIRDIDHDKYNISWVRDVRFPHLINNRSGKIFLHNYPAANIDNQGNVFVLQFFTDKRDESVLERVEITKNKKIVKTIKFSEYVSEIASSARAVEIPAEFYIWSYGGGTMAECSEITYGTSLYLRRIFSIVDENNFAFIIHGNASNRLVSDSFGVALEPFQDVFELATYEAVFYFNSGGSKLMFESNYYGTHLPITVIPADPNLIGSTPSFYWQADWSDSYTEKNYGASKIPLGNDFYCTAEFIPPEGGAVNEAGDFHFEIYSPTNEHIFSADGSGITIFKFLKINGGLLFYFDYVYTISKGSWRLGTAANDAGGGIYFYSDRDQKITLLKTGTCLNQTLCPMKKIRGWQNRIKDYSLDET